MNRKMPYDRVLVVTVFALLFFGLLMVSSASTVVSLQEPQASVFSRQLVSVAVGIGLMLLFMRFDYHWLEHRYLAWGSVVLAGAALIWVLLGPEVNGVRRWIPLGPTRFQPSEAAKFAVVLLTAHCLAKQDGRLQRLDRTMWACIGTILAVFALIVVEPDFGTATTLMVACGLLFFLAGLQYRWLAVAIGIAIPSLFLMIRLSPYRWERLVAFWDPEAAPYTTGYQILQSLVAVGSGGVTGKGLAQGTQKLFFLPEPHTDFIYAVIAEETGLVGCLAVLAMFLVVFWRGLRIGMRADTVFGNFLGLGITGLITFQALFNMSVVLSLCPTKGIPLPFISVGGSSAIVMLSAIGVLLNISKYTRGQVGVSVSPSRAETSRPFPGLVPHGR
ncbi:MAG: putative lipid II flippase FtsW [Acidobacteriota bacterium]